MQGLDPTDPEVVATGGQGLQVEASQGAGGKEAVEGGSHRGGPRVPGGCASGVLASSESEGARGGGGRGRRIGGGGGRPGAALDLWFNDLYGKLYGLFSFVAFYLFLCLAGRI